MRIQARLFFLFALVVLSALSASAAQAAEATFANFVIPGRDLLQFTAGDRIVGFQSSGVYIASGSDLLRLEFAGTVGVQPAVATPGAVNGRVQPLEPVTYANLWNGINVTFQPVAGGIIKSTYVLAPAAQVADIHLRYSVPVQVDSSGNLILWLPTGEYQESAPIAWQNIRGERIPVEVAFQSLAEHEIGFRLGRYDPAYPLVIDPTLQWNTFLGSANNEDAGTGIAADASGNVYVVGYSTATWGSPIRLFTGSYDAFVAKLSSNGSLVWSTFLGGTGRDFGQDVVLDSNGNVYVIGTSEDTWGDNPKRLYTYADVFVAKLNNNGALQWNTFLGGDSADEGTGITVDPNGNIYVAGGSGTDWGTERPDPYTGGWDGFVAKLGSDGTLLWNSFLGSSQFDFANGLAVDSTGSTYIAGVSSASWGSPVRGFSVGSNDAFVAKLDSGGALQWNTFLGSSAEDGSEAVAIDGSGGVYVVGTSYATWGNSPRRSYSNGSDIFVAGLDSSGALQWNTFLGGSSNDLARALSLDAGGNLNVTGDGGATWGSPLRAFTGGNEVAVSKLDSSGTLLWNTFLGGAFNDFAEDGIVDGAGNIDVIGYSYGGWGSPVESFHDTTSIDAFVAKVRKESSTTVLTAHAPNPSLPGQTVTISYTVAADPPGSLTPTGSVTVSDGTVSCTAAVAVGSCSLTFATAGAKNLTASYAGDTDFAGSSSAAAGHHVNTANTTTSITGHTPAPSVAGQAYTVTWMVSITAPATGTPTGTVSVADGSGGTCTAAVATGYCTLVSTTPGTKVLTANYAGDTNFIGSASTRLAHQVNKANTTTSITGHTPAPSVVGQVYTVTWMVSVTSPGTGTLTGTVTVEDGSGVTCTATVAAGHCALASTSPGTKVLTATFSGDSNRYGSSGTVTHEVKINEYRTYLPLLRR